MTKTTRQIGQEGERFAAELLIEQGLELLDKNVTFRVGELDLIMRDNKHLVFVEVRYRKATQFGGALGSITPTKQKRLTRAALMYLQKRRLMDKVPCRFDVVAVTEIEGLLQGQWIKNVF